MQRLCFAAIAFLVSTLILTGCKKREKCAAGDTTQVCQAFQECLKSNTSTAVCRMAEQDADQSRKDLAPAYNGAAAALGGKSSQKSAPQSKH
jgi:uncharacterized protein YgiB involved in biofilm formation